jgi:hypothetical protein
MQQSSHEAHASAAAAAAFDVMRFPCHHPHIQHLCLLWYVVQAVKSTGSISSLASSEADSDADASRNDGHDTPSGSGEFDSARNSEYAVSLRSV